MSLAEAILTEGRRTCMGDKWPIGHEPAPYPSVRGFDPTFALLHRGAGCLSNIPELFGHGSPAEYSWYGRKLEKQPDTFHSSRSNTDFLIRSIRESREEDRPLFAYLAFTALFDPLHLPEESLHRCRGRYDDDWEALHARCVKNAIELGQSP